MKTARESGIDELVAVVADHPEADFYRTAWRGARRFEELPTVGRSDFAAAPLSRRRYKKEKELVKIVHTAEGSFAAAWTFSDTAREQFGTIGKRPMVYLENPHEAIEKSLWCYEQGRVPLVGEQNDAVAAYGADIYRIDSLITDEPSLQKLLPHLEKRDEPLEALSVHGKEFDLEHIKRFERYAKNIALILTLPETGALAQAPFSEEPLFVPCEGVLLQHGENMVATREQYLATPIIKYQTGIRSRAREDDAFIL